MKVQDIPPPVLPSLIHLEKSMIAHGTGIHAFRSGGCLRVVRLEESGRGKLCGYGEHPSLTDAFRIAEDDYTVGGREYSKVYGHKETHYLTGQSSATSYLDLFVLKGCSLDIKAVGDDLIVTSEFTRKFRIPSDVEEKIRSNRHAEVLWHGEDDYIYVSTRSKFGDGSGVSTSVFTPPPPTVPPAPPVPMAFSPRGSISVSGPSLATALHAANQELRILFEKDEL